jgi:hypothetical protein
MYEEIVSQKLIKFIIITMNKLCSQILFGLKYHPKLLEHKILLFQQEDLEIASDFLPPTCNHTHEIIRPWQPRKNT